MTGHPARAPASVGQRLLWMMRHYRAANTTLSCPLLCRLRGAVQVPRLRAALDALVQRHESLRTTFTGHGHRLTQLVHDPVPLPLRQADAAGAELAQAIEQELATPLDPTVQPVRATLWRTSESDHLLCLNMHHLVTDAWSCGVLFRELRALYGGSSGSDQLLSATPWQYRQFVSWQQELLARDGLARHRQYWLGKLTGARAVTLLPGPQTSAAGPEFAGTAREDIPPSVTAALRALARDRGTTLFAVLLATFYLQLARASGRRDLVVASLFANRSRPEVRGTVGFLANMVLLRTVLSDRTSFAEVLRSTHGTVIGAFAHQELPFQLLPPRTLEPVGSIRPDDLVFQVMTDPDHRASAGGVDFELLVPEGIGTRFGCELTLVPVAGGLRVLLFHAAGRLEPAAAQRFVKDYAALIASVTATPDAPVAIA